MINHCNKCGQQLREGDDVFLTVQTAYHEIPSVRVFAVSRILDADSESLRHVTCYTSEE